MNTPQKLIGQIDSIIYENESFFIAVLTDKTKVSGEYVEAPVQSLKGAAVTLEGELVEHKKYGSTFKCTSVKVNQSELFFFLNRVVKGFTKKLTSDLIEKFGEDGLIDVLDNDIEKLLEFKGVKEKKLERIQKSWKQFRSVRELGEFLAPYDVSSAMIHLIATQLKEVTNPAEKIKNNPYVLTHIKGIGFKRADEIAKKMGVGDLDENRLHSATNYLIRELCDMQGNSCISKGLLYERLDDELGLFNRRELYEKTVLEMVHDGHLHQFGELLAPDVYYYAEEQILSFIKKKCKQDFGEIKKDLDSFITQREEKAGFTLSDEQRRAVEILNEGSSILLLVGYAGTGKSTSARLILDLMAEKVGENFIMCTALSGIASQRISETTGYQSSTIQSLIVRYEEKEEMPFKVILLDEASMVNSMLFFQLIKMVDDDAVFIIVGDDGQLPPIGAGNVLSDMINLELAPMVKLTKLYRQSEKQAIALVANTIRQGQVPEFYEEYDDFHFKEVSIANYYQLKNSLSKAQLQELREEHSHQVLASMMHLAVADIPHSRELLKNKDILGYLNAFQVITPMKGGTLGSENLNNVLQQYFNPSTKDSVKAGKYEYRMMDKVVHIKNENMPCFTPDGFKGGSEGFEKRVFNGMVGLVFKIDRDEEVLFVFYPNEELVVQYDFDQLKTYLSLSYALTIHKVQGMEYESVVIPVSYSHFIMHNTKLLYTAITRAKGQCHLVGEGTAFIAGCKKLDTTRRETVLQALCKSAKA
jgi:exodeoxyribonuclease V alpha subunit